MQVILVQDVDHLGGANELATVRNGYARNYLIPKKMAVEANSSNLKQLEEKQKVKAKKEAAMLAEINKVIAVLKESLQLARAIRDQKGYEIDRKRIHISNEVKELGTYKASVDFGNGNSTDIEFEVTGE